MKMYTQFCAGILLITSLLHASDFATQGSRWLGGNFSFTSMGSEISDDRINRLQISPVLRFFPADNFMFGPSLTWNGAFVDSYNINEFSIGAEIGAVFNTENTTFPYIRSGSGITILSYESETEQGFTLPVAAGIIFPVGDVFGIQIEPSYTITWINEVSFNSFGVNFGICGIGEKSIISFAQGFSLLNTMM